MTTTTQTVEATFAGGGVVTVSIDPPGTAVDQAGTVGTTTGQRVVGTAVSTAIGSALCRAGELFAVVQAADRAKHEHEKVLAVIDRRAVEASGLLFGSSLDTRLLELEKQRAAAVESHVVSADGRDRAVKELQSIRDTVVSDGVTAVANDVATRRKAATAERQQVANRLAAVMLEPLAHLLELDAELEVLGRVSADDAVKDELEDALPQVFAGNGLTPHTPYDWRQERAEREAERRRRGWDDISYPAVPAWVGGSDEREDD